MTRKILVPIFLLFDTELLKYRVDTFHGLVDRSHSKADDHLMDSIVNAVAAIAEDMEKAAKSE